MKKLLFSLAFMLIGLFASANTIEINNTTNKIDQNENLESLELLEAKSEVYISHDCYYRVVNSRGETIGHVVLTDVPDNVACGSSLALSVAQDAWDNQ
jgi:hypothetical protein